MEKRVKRSEVNMVIGAKGSPSPNNSPYKGSTAGHFPDANILAQKYGVVEKEECVQLPVPHASLTSQRNEVEMLRKLEEKNKKIEQLCVLLEALEPAPGVDPERIQKLMDEGVDENVDFRDAKIVSLAKKSHRLTMQLNKERSVTDKLNQQVLELQKSVGSLNQELQAAKASAGRGESSKVYNRNMPAAGESTSAEDYLVTIAGLNRDIKESNKQVDDLKRKLAQSVEEGKQLSRALSREIGEGVTLEQAVSGGWRGRAQQIIMLKNKIKRLESGDGAGSSVMSSGYGVASATGRASSAGASLAGSTVVSGAYGGGAGAGGALDVDRRAEEDLVAMSNDRRQIVEALTEERTMLMETNQQLEKKNTAQKARIHNLEADARKLKDSLQLVLDKSNTDDQLDALKEEIARLKAQQAQHQQQLHQAGGGRSHYDGITSRFGGSTVGGASTVRASGAGTVGTHGAGRRDSGSAVAGVTDSLDFLQAQQQMQTEQWEAEQRQLQTEIQRLRRLCKNQADQLETQDGTIRQLKKKLDTDYK